MTEIYKQYYREISRIPLLSREEELDLAEKSFNGDKKAREKLIKANLRFVIKIANTFKGYNLDLEDLINEGNLGLIHAAEKFDPSTNVKFDSYAVWWIRSFIQKAIRETSTGVKFPSRDYKEMKADKWNFASLDKAVNDDEGQSASFGSMIEDKTVNFVEDLEAFEEIQTLLQCVDALGPRDSRIIYRRYGLDGRNAATLGEIGQEVGLSKERVRQLENGLVKKLGLELTAKDVGPYVA